MSFIRNNYEPNCTHTTILIIVTQRLFLCPTSDKRGHIKRTKRAQNGKRWSQKKKRYWIEKSHEKGQSKRYQRRTIQKRGKKKPKHLDIFCISEKLLYMSVHVKTVDKNIRTFSLVIFSWNDKSSISVELQAIIISSSILSTYFYQCVKSSFASNHKNCTDFFNSLPSNATELDLMRKSFSTQHPFKILKKIYCLPHLSV